MNRSRVLKLFKSSGWSGLGGLLLFSRLMNALPASGSISAAAWQEPATPQPPAQPAINYRQPVREYKDVRMGDMKVAIEKQLQAEPPPDRRESPGAIEVGAYGYSGRAPREGQQATGQDSILPDVRTEGQGRRSE